MSEKRNVPCIDRAEVERIARLAHLELDDAEVDGLARELGSILEHVARLEELDVASVEPTASGLERPSVLREDTGRSSLSNEDALANAPDAGEGHFRVPRVLDE